MPGIASARVGSIDRISAWACGERRIAACRVPLGGDRSSAKRARPIRRAASSNRLRGPPMSSPRFLSIAAAVQHNVAYRHRLTWRDIPNADVIASGIPCNGKSNVPEACQRFHDVSYPLLALARRPCSSGYVAPLWLLPGPALRPAGRARWVPAGRRITN
jgi:hypothetical protein